MTGTQPHAPKDAAGRGPNRDCGPCGRHAGAARRCTKRLRRPWAQPGPRAVRGPRKLRIDACTSLSVGCGTLRESRAASGPEELLDSGRTYASTHAYLGTAGRGTRKRATQMMHATQTMPATRPPRRPRKRRKQETWRERRRRRKRRSGRCCASKTSTGVPEVVVVGGASHTRPHAHPRARSRTQAHTCQTTHTHATRAYESMRARTIL
jgi:hypothetical protein